MQFTDALSPIQTSPLFSSVHFFRLLFGFKEDTEMAEEHRGIHTSKSQWKCTLSVWMVRKIGYVCACAFRVPEFLWLSSMQMPLLMHVELKKFSQKLRKIVQHLIFYYNASHLHGHVAESSRILLSPSHLHMQNRNFHSCDEWAAIKNLPFHWHHLKKSFDNRLCVRSFFLFRRLSQFSRWCCR